MTEITVTEIAARLNMLIYMLRGKGVDAPDATFAIRATGEASFDLWSMVSAPAFNGEYLAICGGETVADALALAVGTIADLPAREAAQVTA
jgi:hypothetical protein